MGIPPVANTTSTARMSSCVNSIEGSSMHCTKFLGTPNFAIASLINATVCAEHFLERGCGATIMAFFPLSANMVFDIGVTIGFVVGVIAATTPTGFKIVIRSVTGSTLTIPIDCLPLRSYHTPFDFPLFLATLSS